MFKRRAYLLGRSRTILTLCFGGMIGVFITPAFRTVPVAAAPQPFWTDPTDYGAKCDGATDDTAALQSALNATPAGGAMLFPETSPCLISSTLTISKPIKLSGAGWNSGLLVSSAMSSGSDVIHVFNASNPITGFTMRDFAIMPQAGTPARYGISLDAETGTDTISAFEIDHLFIGQFGSAGIAMLGPDPSIAHDGVFTGTVANSQIYGGLNLTNAGDSLRIENNTITGNGTVTVNLSGQGSNTGHGFLFSGNNVTLSGGIHLVNASSAGFYHNNIELYSGATGSNGAVLDLDGNSSIPPDNVRIEDNTILSGPTVSTCIRVNQVVGAFIGPNRMSVSNAGKSDITVTPSADRTMIFLPWNEPNGELPPTWLSDPGNVGTTLVYMDPNSKNWTFANAVNFNTGLEINGGALLTTTNQTGTGNIVMSNSPTLVSPSLGDATATSLTIGSGVTVGSTDVFPQFIGQITTTANSLDSLQDSRVTVTSPCVFSPTNPISAVMTGVYIATGPGIVTVIHPAKAGGGFNVFCSH